MLWTHRIKAIVLGVGLGLALHTSNNWWNIFIDHVPECSQPNCVADFVMLYAEGTLIREDWLSLYDLDKQLAHQKKIAPTEKVLPFPYPPITALLIAPLALLPFSSAFLGMTVLNVVLLAASLRLLIRDLSLTRDQSHWLVLCALCNFGVHATVFYAQTSVIILFVLTCHVLAQKRSSECKAGLWAALLCFKPQFLPIPHLDLLLRSRWRGLLVGALTSATLIVGPFIVLGTETSRQYFLLAQRMATADNDWWNQWQGMHNLRALTTYWLPENSRFYVWWAGCIVVLATMILSNLRARRGPDGFAESWIINVLALLIVIPHLFTHDLSLLVLPCALLISMFKQTVPLFVGLGLVVLGLLPALNYAFPTVMAVTLVILFPLSLTLVRHGRFAGVWTMTHEKTTPSDTTRE
jgi:hypothetical protein